MDWSHHINEYEDILNDFMLRPKVYFLHTKIPRKKRGITASNNQNYIFCCTAVAVLDTA